MESGSRCLTTRSSIGRYWVIQARQAAATGAVLPSRCPLKRIWSLSTGRTVRSCRRSLGPISLSGSVFPDGNSQNSLYETDPKERALRFDAEALKVRRITREVLDSRCPSRAGVSQIARRVWCRSQKDKQFRDT